MRKQDLQVSPFFLIANSKKIEECIFRTLICRSISRPATCPRKHSLLGSRQQVGGGGRAAGCSVQGAGVLILTGKLDAQQFYPAKLGLNKRMNKLHLWPILTTRQIIINTSWLTIQHVATLARCLFPRPDFPPWSEDGGHLTLSYGYTGL